MAELITVKATMNDKRVVLWEQHSDHPTGEIFISGDGKSVKVANTAAVQRRIKAGLLVEVKSPNIVQAIAEAITPEAKTTEADKAPVAAEGIEAMRRRKGE